jgi:hypothetical protein
MGCELTVTSIGDHVSLASAQDWQPPGKGVQSHSLPFKRYSLCVCAVSCCFVVAASILRRLCASVLDAPVMHPSLVTLPA